MKKLAIIFSVLAVCSVANAQTRERYIDAPGDQGHIQVYDATSGVSILTYSDTGVTITGLTANAGTFTTASVAGRYPILGANATNSFVIDRGTTTNGATVVFTTAFSAAPEVYVDYAAYVATNVAAGPSSVTTSNFVANGTVAKILNWMAIGPK